MARAKERARRVVILMAVGGFVFSSVAVTILALTSSGQTDQTDQQKLLEQLQQQQQGQAESAAKEPLPGYAAAAFDPAAVTSLQVETIKAGEGKAATTESTVNANYFGWTSNGQIFDSTNSGGSVTPIDFPLNQVIPGWTEGLNGVKAGSTVKLTTPADKAYGAEDKGDGRPVGPLVFIIEVKEVK